MTSEMKQWLDNVRINATDACSLINKDYPTPEQWVQLLFSPQGIEYCTSRNYPTIEQWRNIRLTHQQLSDMHIYIDRKLIELSPEGKIALIGDCHAIIRVNDTKSLRTIILLHGATATIIAKNYATIKVEKSADSNVKIIKDQTAIVL